MLSDENIRYSTKAFITWREVRSKVANHFLKLDLAFLDEDSKDKPVADLEAAADPQHELYKDFLLFLYVVLVCFRADLLFVMGLQPRLLKVNERIFPFKPRCIIVLSSWLCF